MSSPTGRAGDYLPGDVLAFYGRGSAGRAISRLQCLQSLDAPSHVGVVVPQLCVVGRPELDLEPVMLHATSLHEGDCDYAQRPVKGVQLHRARAFVAAYPGRVRRYRVNALRPLSQFDLQEFARVSESWLRRGVRYDRRGAALSVTTFLRGAAGTGARELFCSELVALLLMCVCRYPIGASHAISPARLCRTLRGLAWFDGPEVMK